MSPYTALIIEATRCDPDEAAEIEEVMRNTIFHGTLDWQTASQLREAARKAVQLLVAARSVPTLCDRCTRGGYVECAGLAEPGTCPFDSDGGDL